MRSLCFFIKKQSMVWFWVIGYGFWVRFALLLEQSSIGKALLPKNHNPKPITIKWLSSGFRGKTGEQKSDVIIHWKTIGCKSVDITMQKRWYYHAKAMLLQGNINAFVLQCRMWHNFPSLTIGNNLQSKALQTDGQVGENSKNILSLEL